MITVSAEKPLAGAVLCCTSVSPELRTQYAEYAQQMGAEHKLDLTSDVTHLLVGDTDTLKYKYVAREREDVKVLRPDFVEAVRIKWMQDQSLDIDAIEHEYRLAPFHGLKICITGFDDMSFRSQLQQNVLENGGLYSGDLTKEVTHLVAAAPEGKKYEYATQWQKKVVSLKWYKDTLTRGMQLDESLYHPSKPVDEQGIGAWNHRPLLQPNLGKRQREEQEQEQEQEQDQPTVAPPRKLRRTASSRLSSQTDNMWSDIVTGGAFEIDSDPKPPLRPTKSMPVLNPASNTESFIMPAPAETKHGYFEGKHFAIMFFDHARSSKLQSIIMANGGVVVKSPHDLQNLDSQSVEARLLLVPSQLSYEDAPIFTKINLVSELWLEFCMEMRSYIPPSQYVYGSLLSRVKPTGFSKLIIASNGFPGIQLLHTSKMVTALGARYSEVFNDTVSVLVCKSGSENPQKKVKMQRAQAWGIPVVSEMWLYSCIQNNRKQPFEAHLLQRPRSVTPAIETSRLAAQRRSELENLRQDAELPGNNHPVEADEQRAPSAAEINSVKTRNVEKQRPGSDFLSEVNESTVQRGKPKNKTVQDSSTRDGEDPLKEISPNQPTKQLSPEKAPKPKKALFRTFDGSSSFTDENQLLPEKNLLKEDRPLSNGVTNISNARTLNGEIQDLLSITAKTKPTLDANIQKTKQLVGRALSNLSNASATSQRKLSRASSVDSMNTDGIGSEIGPVSGRSEEMTDPRSFTGRAKSRLLDGVGTSIDLGHLNLSIEDLPQQEDAVPILTQLVYDDPEETIMLREKLAAKRRARSKVGQKEGDPKPEKPREQQQRKIKDDDVLAHSGWAGAGRTRRGGKLPTPEAFTEF